MVRTRELLVDVSRQLFARQGVAATTMNDIAVASGKGRRTIYTYFKNKDEVYWAVIEAESDYLYARLEGLANRDLPPEEKLLNYLNLRMEAVKEVVVRNGSLRAEFFRDIWKVERARKGVDVREVALLRTILEEGVAQGVFHIPNVTATAALMHHALRGLDVPYIRDNFSELGIERTRLKDYVLDFILYGIKR